MCPDSSNIQKVECASSSASEEDANAQLQHEAGQLLEGKTEDQKRQILDFIGVEVCNETLHSGPIPSPTILREYEVIYPGAAKLILDEFREIGLHTRKQEDRLVRHSIRSATIGQIIAGIVAIGVIVLAAYITYLGHSLFGLVSLVTGLGSLLGVFFLGTRAERQVAQNTDENNDSKKNSQHTIEARQSTAQVRKASRKR